MIELNVKLCNRLPNSNPICSSNQSYVQDVEVEGGVDSSAAADKGTVKIMGSGPLLPVRAIRGILKEALMPFFVKKLKQPKHLDALQPSSTVDDGIALPLQDAGEDNCSKVEAEAALDDRVGTFKVRGIPFVPFLFSPRLGLGSFYDYSVH